LLFDDPDRLRFDDPERRLLDDRPFDDDPLFERVERVRAICPTSSRVYAGLRARNTRACEFKRLCAQPVAGVART
jgi:hypothetical protein